MGPAQMNWDLMDEPEILGIYKRQFLQLERSQPQLTFRELQAMDTPTTRNGISSDRLAVRWIHFQNFTSRCIGGFRRPANRFAVCRHPQIARTVGDTACVGGFSFHRPKALPLPVRQMCPVC